MLDCRKKMTTNNIEDRFSVLKDIGLDDEEIAAYTALLKSGESGATELAKDIGVKRTTIYPILEGMMEKGIVSSYKRGAKQYFVAIRPNKLVSVFERKVQSLTHLVPALEKILGSQGKAYGVRFIQTKREFEAFYNGVLEDYRGKEYYIIGNANAFINVDTDFILDFRKKRALRNIRTKLLLSHDSKSAVGQDDPSLIREFKYLPASYEFKSTIDIYDDKILIIGPEVRALAVEIAIPPMVDVFRSVFEVLWDSVAK